MDRQSFFLNYPPLIEQSFGQCLVKTDQQGFKVLYACANQGHKLV